MKKFNRIGFILILVMLLTSSFAFADYYSDKKGTLRGLKGVAVVIEDLKPEIEKDGLTVSQIRTDVELKLRLAGIEVLSREESLRTPGQPFLYVNANILKLNNNREYVYNISVGLNQIVLLKRNMKISCTGATWDTGRIGITPYLNDIRTNIKDLVDNFINDYLAVNPK